MATDPTGNTIHPTRLTAGSVVVALLLALLTPVAGARAADTLTVDFETGPPLGTPVTDDYLGSAFTRFLAADSGFRPYRRSAPGQARSGTVAADVGIDVCFPETQDGLGCEFVTPNMTGRLTRTATSVTLYAGLFTPSAGDVSARLTAYRANGSTAAVGAAVPISAAGFTAPVTVSSAAPDIARFELTVEGSGALNASLGFDDLTLSFPDSSLPDISLGSTSQVVTVLQGGSTEIPVDITRLNGSDGPVDMSVTGLPAGVAGTFLTDPVPGTQQSTTLRLSGTDNADTFSQPVDVTITGDPMGNVAVAPGSRSTTSPIVVASAFRLSVAGATQVVLPDCAPADVELRVQRNITFTGTVNLAAATAGTGVSAEFLPSAVVPPGGGLIAERTLRLSRTEPLNGGQAVYVTATAPGAPQRTVRLNVSNGSRTASLAGTVGLTPRRGQPGTQIRVDGNGFCPGTTVQVGNPHAVADTQVAPDLRSLTFRVPRLATTGAVTIIPPRSAPYRTSNELTVRSFRNTSGFAFRNYGYEYLSFEELTDLVGIREMFVEVNPCWPLGRCPIPTGIPDPLAYITWGVLNIVLRNSGGHCFGINRTVQELLAGKVSYLQFASGVDQIYDLPSPTGPNAALNRWLDARHAGQGTAEFLWAFLTRERSLSTQLAKVRSELAAGRHPGISLRSGWAGHVVTAYDVEDQPDGSVLVYVYDNNRPFEQGELSDADLHRSREVVESVVKVSADGDAWEFQKGDDTRWTGGGGTWFTIPLSVIPDDPSLPGLNALTSITVFGSTGAAARVALADLPEGAEYLPAQDGNAVPGAAGFIVAPASLGKITHTVSGSADGSYSESISGDGFVAAVTDVATGAGVDDTVTASPRRGWLRFAGERDRPLEIDVAISDGGVNRAASLRTRTFAGGQERVALGSGRSLTYRHRGPATTVSFTLTDADRTGVSRFSSGPITMVKGQRITATPKDWGSLERVRLRSVVAGERTTTVLTDRSKNRTRLTLREPKVKNTAKRSRASVRFRVVRAVAESSAGVVFRLVRGGRTVARKSIGLADPGRGGTVKWRLPGKAKGRYVLRADATLLIGGTAPDTVHDRAKARVRLR